MKKRSKLLLIFTLLLVLGVGVTSYFYLNKNEVKEESKESKVELKYTETVNKEMGGIYITDVSEIVENTMPSIVAITSKTLVSNGRYGPNYFGSSRYVEGAGSGIIISKSDDELYILTNNHVVEDAKELTVKFINDKTVDAKIKGTSERKDIAIVSISLDDLDKETIDAISIATIGNSNELKVGNGIIAIGNALGYGQSVTTGVVSALDRKIETDTYSMKMIQIDAAINGGNSGGALLNSRGEVVGINSAKYSSNGYTSSSIEGMGFAIPISDVEDLIMDLINGREDSGMTLGIEGYMTSYLSEYDLPDGFYITKILDNSNADRARLEIGNIITKIDNEKVNSINDIKNVLYDKKPGDTVLLTIKYISGREYKEKEVIAILK